MKKRQSAMYNRNSRIFGDDRDSRYYSDYDYPPNQPRRLNRQKRRRR